MPQVLFLCTGNYYRSRFAEILFNSLAPAAGLAWTAFSRAIALNPDSLNVGPISPHAVMGLVERGIRVAPDIRLPAALTAAELHGASLVVALHEPEHRPILQERFPGKMPAIEFWTAPDVGEAPPSVVLPGIERDVRALIGRLTKTATPPGTPHRAPAGSS